MWQHKMRRLEAHGDEYKLPATYKINALRMLMIGKSKKHFGLWEANRDHTDVVKSYVELLNKVKDRACKRKLDGAAPRDMQHGTDPMDIGALQGNWSEYHCGDCGEEDTDIDSVGYYVYTGKGKGKSKGKGGSGYNWGSPGRKSART
jgi:hypothetical protein